MTRHTVRRRYPLGRFTDGTPTRPGALGGSAKQLRISIAI